jgi:hypothetical protein
MGTPWIRVQVIALRGAEQADLPACRHPVDADERASGRATVISSGTNVLMLPAREGFSPTTSSPMA